MQHLRGRGLLFQRFRQIVGALAQLVEQPRVLDRDDRLGGEVLQQLDLLVGERPHLLFVNVDRPDQLAILQHRYLGERSAARQLDRGNAQRIAVAIGLALSDVLDLHELLGLQQLAEPGVRPGPDRLAEQEFAVGLRSAVNRDGAEQLFFFTQPQSTELRPADAGGVFQERLEHRLKLAGRAGDDLEHLAGRGLLFQRLRQIVGALAELVEQAGVLDGDHGLGGEVLNQLYLFFGEGTHFPAVNGDTANRFAFLEHWDHNYGPNAGELDCTHGQRFAAEIGRIFSEICGLYGLASRDRPRNRYIRSRPVKGSTAPSVEPFLR